MSAGAFLDKIKNAFSLGAGNRWLFGNGQSDENAYEYPDENSGYYGREDAQYQSAAQPNYQSGYENSPYAEQRYNNPYNQPNYAQREPDYAQGYSESRNYRAPEYQSPQEQVPQFQSQFAPEGYTPKQRNRRTDKFLNQEENVVPFPEESAAQVQSMDAYVINVNSVSACRQAMICLRKGHCAIIVMDRIADRAETRRYVDMLTGACYALNGTMTRLSSKIGFYLMAPSNMTVYTDAVTSNANNPKQMQTGSNFTQSAAANTAPYGSAPQMNFNQSAYGNTQQTGFNQSAYGNTQQTGFNQSVYGNAQQANYSAQPQSAYYNKPVYDQSAREPYYPQSEMA